MKLIEVANTNGINDTKEKVTLFECLILQRGLNS